MFGHLRNSKLPFQRSQLVEVDRADDIDDCQLARLGRDDHQAGDAVAARLRVNLDVVARAALHGHDALPIGTELRADAIDDRAVVGAIAVEFVAVHVDALELAHDVAHIAVIVGEELRREPQHRPVEIDVNRFDGLEGERLRDVDVDAAALRPARSRYRQQNSDDNISHNYLLFISC